MNKVLIAIGIAGLLLVVVLAVAINISGAPDSGPRSARNPAVFLYSGLGGSAAIAGTGLALWVWAALTLRRARLIAANNPSAVVLVAQKTRATEGEISQLTGTPERYLPSLIVIGIGQLDVAIWGYDEGRPVATFHRDQIKEVRVVDAHIQRSLPAVQLEIAVSAGGTVNLTFVPCRPGWELWAVLDRAKALEIARKFPPSAPA